MKCEYKLLCEKKRELTYPMGCVPWPECSQYEGTKIVELEMTYKFAYDEEVISYRAQEVALRKVMESIGHASRGSGDLREVEYGSKWSFSIPFFDEVESFQSPDDDDEAQILHDVVRIMILLLCGVDVPSHNRPDAPPVVMALALGLINHRYGLFGYATPLAEDALDNCRSFYPLNFRAFDNIAPFINYTGCTHVSLFHSLMYARFPAREDDARWIEKMGKLDKVLDKYGELVAAAHDSISKPEQPTHRNATETLRRCAFTFFNVQIFYDEEEPHPAVAAMFKVAGRLEKSLARDYRGIDGLLYKNDIFIAGGFVAKLFNEYGHKWQNGDLDVFYHVSAAPRVMRWLEWAKAAGWKLVAAEGVITLATPGSGNAVQLIPFFEAPDVVLGSIDFSPCKVAYVDGKVLASLEALWALKHNKILMAVPKYPLDKQGPTHERALRYAALHYTTPCSPCSKMIHEGDSPGDYERMAKRIIKYRHRNFRFIEIPETSTDVTDAPFWHPGYPSGYTTFLAAGNGEYIRGVTDLIHAAVLSGMPKAPIGSSYETTRVDEVYKDACKMLRREQEEVEEMENDSDSEDMMFRLVDEPPKKKAKK